MAQADGDEIEDWAESGLPFWQYMVSGACAGMAEHCVMFPFDTIKTRMQVAGGANGTVLETLRSIIRTDGTRAIFRGVGAQFTGCGPAHAMYFSAYEGVKHVLVDGRQGSLPAAHAAAGAVATVGHDGFMTPFDVVKQRMQLGEQGGHHRHFVACMRSIHRQEGTAAFFVSFRTTLLMNVPYQMCQFATYEFVKSKLAGPVEVGGEFRYTPLANMVAGGVAGGCAASITTPLDVVKTRLQTQGVTNDRYNGALDAARTMHRQEGVSAFVRGVVPRVMFHIPSMAICWTTYESVKYMLQLRNK